MSGLVGTPTQYASTSWFASPNRSPGPGAVLLAEMWEREGVSASHEDLQRSLGVTRNRLTELLRALDEHGVLAT